MFLRPLSKLQTEYIFKNKIAKYLSQNNKNRHYLIKYMDDGKFRNDTYELNYLIGSSFGTYSLSEKQGDTFVNIQYQKVFTSPNIKSPFHPNNDFHRHLFSGYTIGPLYSKLSIDDTLTIPVLYDNLNTDYTFKILNFY